MTNEPRVEDLVTFHLVLYKPTEGGKGTTRTKVQEVRRTFFDEKTGIPLRVEDARKLVAEFKRCVPETWSLFVVEEPSSPTSQAPRFEATCLEHGLRINEFFCGHCGEELRNIKICG